ncbi:hypothetical protein C725_1799 [Pacificimonas flava]|uniref:Uncharacterized protein n=1 Tax=Pacificimonas flava TaxID=1234595 RepID=M2T8B3_9SPHN|nr:hypothetical protein C725_1799 [Pacificimonas flava]
MSVPMPEPANWCHSQPGGRFERAACPIGDCSTEKIPAKAGVGAMF